MKKWQKFWLSFLILYSLVHIVRDIFQDLGIKNILSTVLVKYPPSKPSFYWQIFNTYIFAIAEILLSVLILRRKRFGWLGYVTVLIAVIIFSAWLFFWFYL